jgi:hypothetical protein
MEPAKKNSLDGSKSLIKGFLVLFFSALSVSGLNILAGFTISTGLISDKTEHNT